MKEHNYQERKKNHIPPRDHSHAKQVQRTVNLTVKLPIFITSAKVIFRQTFKGK